MANVTSKDQKQGNEQLFQSFLNDLSAGLELNDESGCNIDDTDESNMRETVHPTTNAKGLANYSFVGSQHSQIMPEKKHIHIQRPESPAKRGAKKKPIRGASPEYRGYVTMNRKVNNPSSPSNKKQMYCQ